MTESKVLRLQMRDMRLAFPNLSKEGKFGFGARAIFPPDHTQTLNPGSRAFCAALGIKVPADPKAKVKTLPLLKAIVAAVAKKKWAEKGTTIVNGLEGQDKLFYHNGNTKSELDGFEGNYFLALGARGPVPMFNADRSEATERECYSGSYCNFLIDVWAQDNSVGGKRINASVYGVQKVRDGDAFGAGGTPADADDFDDISAEDSVEGEEATDDSEDLTA